MLPLYTAFTIGLIGSLHCIGMCGPIAIALPLGSKGFGNRLTGTLLYNLGRIITYGILGSLFGLLGKGFEMAGIQRWVSITAGIMMISWILFPILFHRKFLNLNFGDSAVNSLISKLRKLFGKQSFINLFLIGLLNGLLPCGLVYVAIAGAINTNDPIQGVFFMMLFGIGTLPIMASVSILGNVMSLAVRNKISKIIPVFIITLGIIFIIRGLTLGIPYISPKQEALNPAKEVKIEGSCCSPKSN